MLPRPARAASIALTLACWTLLAGCRARPPQGDAMTGVGSLRACELLTLAEADPDGREALQPMRTGVDASEGTQAAKCSYASGGLPPRVVALELRRYRTASLAGSAQRAAAGFLPSLSGVSNEPVPGLGDEALWAGGRLGQLHVRAGALRLIATVEVGEEGSREARARALTRRALARLDQAGLH